MFFLARIVVVIFLTQILSFSTTGSGVFSELLATRVNVSAPATQGWVNYVMLSIVFAPIAIFLPSSAILNLWKRRSGEVDVVSRCEPTTNQSDSTGAPDQTRSPGSQQQQKQQQFSEIGAHAVSLLDGTVEDDIEGSSLLASEDLHAQSLIVMFKQKIMCSSHGESLYFSWRHVLWFFMLGLVDVEANYCAVKAYRYTNIASVMLLDCFSVPIAMVISFFAFRTRYGILHIVFVSLSLCGVVVLVLSDSVNSLSSPSENPLFGDLLCLLAGSLYAVSMTTQQALLARFSQIEVLAMLGLMGTVVGGIQICLFEIDEMAALVNVSSGTGIAYAFGFGLSLFVLYTLCPLTINISSATVVTITFLTSDIYGALFAEFLFDDDLSPFFALSFLCVAVGVIGFTFVEQRRVRRKVQTLRDSN